MCDINEIHEVLLIYDKTAQKVNLTAILIHNVTENITVLLMIAKTASKGNLLKFWLEK